MNEVLEGVVLSEIKKDKYCYDITYMWNLKNKTSEYNKEEADSQM